MAVTGLDAIEELLKDRPRMGLFGGASFGTNVNDREVHVSREVPHDAHLVADGLDLLFVGLGRFAGVDEI